MGLREAIRNDVKNILGDAYGFAWDVSVTDPNGLSVPDLQGFSNDIGVAIDPDTGQWVSARVATVALHLDTLIANGLSIPEGISDSNSKPWVIEFKSIIDEECKFKVTESHPDRSVGLVTCKLEQYRG